MYKMIVIIYKLVSYDYFMDEMQIIDVNEIIRYIQYAETSSLIQTRQLMLATLQPHLKNHNVKASDLWPLAIDKDAEEASKGDTSISNDSVTWFENNKDMINSEIEKLKTRKELTNEEIIQKLENG